MDSTSISSGDIPSYAGIDPAASTGDPSLASVGSTDVPNPATLASSDLLKNRSAAQGMTGADGIRSVLQFESGLGSLRDKGNAPLPACATDDDSDDIADFTTATLQVAFANSGSSLPSTPASDDAALEARGRIEGAGLFMTDFTSAKALADRARYADLYNGFL